MNSANSATSRQQNHGFLMHRCISRGAVPIWCCAVLSFAALSARAVPYSFSWNSGFANAGVVPDGNTTGWFDTRALSGIPENSILDVNVTLSLSDGWNGDLYAYLTHGSGFSVLLNRVGTGLGGPPQFTFGFSTAGFDNITLDDSASPNIHTVENPTSNMSFAPDGGVLSSFNSLDPNGDWTLFVADLSNGEESTVTSWGLNIQAQSTAAAIPDAGSTLSLLGLALAGLTVLAGKGNSQRRTTGSPAHKSTISKRDTERSDTIEHCASSTTR